MNKVAILFKCGAQAETPTSKSRVHETYERIEGTGILYFPSFEEAELEVKESEVAAIILLTPRQIQTASPIQMGGRRNGS